MRIRISELTSTALDWAIAICGGLRDEQGWSALEIFRAARAGGAHRYTSDPTQSAHLIKRERIALYPEDPVDPMAVLSPDPNTPHLFYRAYGSTTHEAALRCFVASRSGGVDAEVDVPDELLAIV